MHPRLNGCAVSPERRHGCAPKAEESEASRPKGNSVRGSLLAVATSLPHMLVSHVSRLAI